MAHSEELDRLGRLRDKAWEAKERSKQSLDQAWEYLQNLQSRYGGQISSLKDDHDRTFEEMKSSFERASDAFEAGDHDDAAYYSSRGRDLKSRLPDLVAQRRRLIAELEDARNTHRQWVDNYRPLKADFLEAKAQFDEYLASLKAEQQRQRDSGVVAKARPDGKTDNYFGGYGSPAGPGHGHTVVDQFGREVYSREAEKHMPGTGRHERVSKDDRNQ